MNEKPDFTFDQSVAHTLNLTKAEHDNMIDFHKKRLMFAFVPDMRYKTNDGRDHCNWLHEEYGIDADSFEDMDRGYIMPIHTGAIRAIVYRGIAHAVTEVTQDMVNQIIHATVTEFPDACCLEIYTGCHIGKIGEIWEPVKFITKVMMD